MSVKKLILGIILIVCISCQKDEVSSEPNLVIKFKFDPNQVRLNNLGQPASVPNGNAAQTPKFNSISAHYFELAPSAFTQLGQGNILYHAPETMAGGSSAIDFNQSKIVEEDEVFLSIPLSQVTQGTYEWVRVSLSYQNFDISVRNNAVDYEGTFASFVGFNTFINTHTIGNNSFPVNANRSQGYWAFALKDLPYANSGQAPAGATTVPNPLASTSPIPAGSCVVTGKFPNSLVINGNETKDIIVTLSLSINNSIEWTEVNADGKFEPSIGENIVDMGLRGLIPTFSK